jgi:hypothetical protein
MFSYYFGGIVTKFELYIFQHSEPYNIEFCSVCHFEICSQNKFRTLRFRTLLTYRYYLTKLYFLF